MVLNGIEIDNEASWWQIRFPSPANHEENVEARDGEVTASWTRPKRGSEGPFLVYFGPEPGQLELVANWTRETEVTFKGKWCSDHLGLAHRGMFSLLTRHVTLGVESGEQYYWRVDMLEDFYYGLFRGRTNTFTVA